MSGVLGRWKRWGIEATARDLYRELVKLDKRIVIARFTHTPEPIVLVFARGDRAADLERIAAIKTDDSKSAPAPTQPPTGMSR